ncbi:MAG: valine--tRNA ligase [Phycisphaerales bacterium]|nr:valine--tRNA ligase [Phycisphaerales bacterium]
MTTESRTVAGEMPKQYRPAEHEGEVRAKWDVAGAFHADPGRVLRGEAAPYCVFIPPPNVTAALHLGHALNNTLQDVLVRAHRMKGLETLWMPGTDHAGIATQTVVERRVRTVEGKARTGFTREAFVAKIQAFKDEYEAKIVEQLKRMGCSCDWDRQRFTMDEVCGRAVREAFFRLFRDGLIYRGKRLVNWDPVTQTALADDEVEMRDIDGQFFYLRYPLVHPPAPGADAVPVTWNELSARGYPGAGERPGDEEAWVTVATTRPETYLGDTAVGVNPKDPRATALRGLMVELPLVGRIIPVIEDDYVVMPAAMGGDPADPKAQFATGFLKVTPAHDPNDYEIGRRHALPVINVMAPDASISDRHGWTDVGDAGVFVGKSREECRKLVVREFDARGLLEARKPYRHAVGHSYRSQAAIEPYLSDQWYVRVTDDRLKGSALRALHSCSGASSGADGGRNACPTGAGGDSEPLAFFPSRYAKTYQSWHENIRDWCISRQLWWGHRIPVWEAPPNGELDDREISEALASGRVAVDPTAAPGTPVRVCVRDADDTETIRRLESRGFVQDPDVLDTWFSSALWPMSTLGWPDAGAAARETGIADFPALLDAFNPSDVLVTGRDIITLWVSRMVMFNRYFMPPAGEPAASAGHQPGEGRLPFRHVYINPIIQDGHGQRMSKSLGNGVDPLDIVESHGADALRFVLTQVATSTQDVRLPVDLVCPHTGKTFTPRFITSSTGHQVPAPVQESPGNPAKKMVTAFGVASGQAQASAELPVARNTSAKFDLGRNFATKLWNATRLTVSLIESERVRGAGPAALPPHALGEAGALSSADGWMLSRLAGAVRKADEALASYEFSVYAQAMYDILWRDYCDWYLEAVKPTAAASPAQRAVLRHALDAILRLLHPIMPHVTEVAWGFLRQCPGAPLDGIDLGHAGSLLCRAPWPRVRADLENPGAEEAFGRVVEVVSAVREVRARLQVPPKRLVTLHLPADLAAALSAGGDDRLVKHLAGVEACITAPAPPGAAEFTLGPSRLAISNMADAVDAGQERTRLDKAIGDLKKSIGALEGRLGNPGYADRAPAHLVQQSRDELSKKREELSIAEAALRKLG